MTAENIRSLIDGSIWTRYYKFCLERNPWDKAVSLYFWRTRGQEPRPSLLSFLNTIEADSLSNFGIYSIGGDVAVDHVGPLRGLEVGNRRYQGLARPHTWRRSAQNQGELPR